MTSSSPPSLADRVVVVAGATRGAGRGIATAFGEAGATVICTGRSSRHADLRSDYQRPETIEETAELVTAHGGRGIPRAVDHLDIDHVDALAAWLRTEFGRIDVLVNDIWGGEGMVGNPDTWDRPIWELDLGVGLHMVRNAVHTHLITAHRLLPLLTESAHGLHVEVTDGTDAYNDRNYRVSVFYDLSKVAVNRLAFSLGHELAPHGCTAVAVTPGWMRSEMMLEHFGVTESDWRRAVDPAAPTAPPGFATSESPRYVGRCIAAIAADPERGRWNQMSVDAGTLAREYDVVDVDGSRPDAWRYMADQASDPSVDPNRYR